MKCSHHPDQDAVAICRVCGGGVCQSCQIKWKGISYCKECIQSGRVKI